MKSSIDNVISAVDILIRKIIEMGIGNIMNVSQVNFSNLFTNGISDLNFLDYKINQDYLENQPFLLESGKIDNLKCELNKKDKRIIVIVSKVELCFFMNDDIYSKQKVKTEKTTPKSNGFFEKIQKSLIDNILNNYHLELQVRDICVKIRPCQFQVLAANEWFSIEIPKFSVIKPPIIQKGSVSSLKKEYKIIMGLDNPEIYLNCQTLTGNFVESLEDVEYFTKSQCFLAVKGTITTEITLMFNEEVITMKTSLNVPLILIVCFPNLIPFSLCFLARIQNFLNSMIINEELHDDSTGGKTEINISQLMNVNIEKMLVDSINQISESVKEKTVDGIHEVMASEIKNTFVYNSKLSEVLITFHKIIIAFYNPDEFSKSSNVNTSTEEKVERIKIETSEMEDNFVFFALNTNYQLLIEKLLIHHSSDGTTKSKIDNLMARKFFFPENSKYQANLSSHKVLNASMMNASMIFHSIVDNPFIFTNLFDISNFSNENEKSTEVINENVLTSIYENQIKTDFKRKGSENSSIVDAKSSPLVYPIYFGIKNKLIHLETEVIKVNLEPCLDFISIFTSTVEKALIWHDKIFALQVLPPAKLENLYCIYYKNLDALISKNLMKNLTETSNRLKKKVNLTFCGSFTFQLKNKLIQVFQKSFDEKSIMQISNLKFSSQNLKPAKSKFAIIEEVTFFENVKAGQISFFGQNYVNGSSNSLIEIVVHSLQMNETQFSKNLDFDNFFSRIKVFFPIFEQIKKSMMNSLQYLLKLDNFYEVFEQKKQFNVLAQKIVDLLIPSQKLCDVLSVELFKVNVTISDNNSAFLTKINQDLKSETQIFKQMSYFQESLKFLFNEINQVKLIDMQLERARFDIKNEEELIFSMEKALINFFPSFENLGQIKVKKMSGLFSESSTKISIGDITCAIRPVKKGMKYLSMYLEEVLMTQIVKFAENWDKIFQNENILSKNTLLTNNESDVLKDDKKYNVIVQINTSEVNITNLLHGIKLKTDNIRLENDKLEISQVVLYNFYDSDSSAFSASIIINSIFRENNDVVIKEVNFEITKEIIFIMIEFYEKILSNSKILFSSFEKIKKEISEKTTLIEQKMSNSINDKSLLQSNVQKEKFIQGFLVLEDNQEIFDGFNKCFKKDKHFISSLDFFKKKCQETLKTTSSQTRFDMNFFVKLIMVKFDDPDLKSFFIFKLQNFFLQSSADVLIVILDQIRVDLEKEDNRGKILENTEKDFYLKFYLESQKNRELNIYVKPSNLCVFGDQKVWDLVDMKIKDLLNWFNNNDSEEEKSYPKDNLMAENEEVVLNEGLIESWTLELKFDFMINALNIPMLANSTETIFKPRVLLSDFVEQISKNMNMSISSFYKSLSAGQFLKIMSFVFARVFRFVFVKKNFRRVNRTIFKLLQRKKS